MFLLFALQPPIYITRAFISCHLIPTLCSKGRSSDSNDIVTVSCNRHVIATSKLLARLWFFGLVLQPHSPPPILIPFQVILDADQRHTSSLATRQVTNPLFLLPRL